MDLNKTGVNSRAHEGQAVPTSYKTFNMLLIKPSRVGHLYIKQCVPINIKSTYISVVHYNSICVGYLLKDILTTKTYIHRPNSMPTRFPYQVVFVSSKCNTTGVTGGSETVLEFIPGFSRDHTTQLFYLQQYSNYRNGQILIF